ncbi:hypothetical protein FGG08_005656 [Glutinoglossum americanum]|uniref:Uncharacterized protein n=1 Tax=Glutinoglossum americanum TaxID=1670608 RepID=A0A9P8HU43_9PEZI|nr:hypothetical protein FGG08_005656 [Glutinoglossum americanum]
MAVTFLAGSATLANWGFSVGDVAAIAGAGRAVSNWLMAPRKDRALLEFLSVRQEDIIERRGLVDVMALHKRWDQKLVLLKNGKRCHITLPSKGPVVENMDGFTWFMSLVLATLDASISSQVLRSLVSRFLMAVLSDKISAGSDYLLHELPQHICGWRSAACVRGISNAARISWRNLAVQGKHQAGDIPESDSGEVVRLLVWIVAGDTPSFTTSSTDVLSLAIVLAEIGLEMLTAGDDREYDEGRLVVYLSTSSIPQGPLRLHNDLNRRRGMRVPVNQLEECVSLWPGDADMRNKQRLFFTNGVNAAAGVKLAVAGQSQTHYSLDEESLDVYYLVQADKSTDRIEPAILHILEMFLLASTSRAAKLLFELGIQWPSKARTDLGWWLGELQMNSEREDEIGHFDRATRKCMAELQAFLLGYYYAILMPLIDTSELSLKEAYGSWGWNDIQVFKAIKWMKLGEDKDNNRYPRYQVMKLAGYLFAGVDYKEQLKPMKERSVGILGKLMLVTAGLMGGADTPEKVGKFYLLDVDPSCIPSDLRGIVLCGLQRSCSTVEPASQAKPLQIVSATTPDFTSTVEPDWDYDVQKVLVAYRNHGRIVHRISPVDGDIAVLRSWVEPVHVQECVPFVLESAIPVALEEFYGDQVVAERKLTSAEIPEALRTAKFPPLVTLTRSLPKARVCILAMYGPGVSTLCSDSIAEAVKRRGRAIVA